MADRPAAALFISEPAQMPVIVQVNKSVGGQEHQPVGPVVWHNHKILDAGFLRPRSPGISAALLGGVTAGAATARFADLVTGVVPTPCLIDEVIHQHHIILGRPIERHGQIVAVLMISRRGHVSIRPVDPVDHTLDWVAHWHVHPLNSAALCHAQATHTALIAQEPHVPAHAGQALGCLEPVAPRDLLQHCVSIVAIEVSHRID